MAVGRASPKRKSAGTRQPGSAPAESFLSPPVPAVAVHRDRLLSLLDLALEQRLTIVVAPPGYGKTVLLSQWASSRRRERVRWLTVRPDHNDTDRFARALCAALAPTGRLSDAVTATGTEWGRIRIGPGFLRTLPDGLEVTRPTTLVLDDFHILSRPALVDEFAAVVDQAPRSLHVVLATRADPPLRYYRLRVSDALVEIRQDDLAFTRDEGARLISRVAGNSVSAAHVDALVARTEGWAVGLQLAALSLRERPDVDDFVATFAGDDRHVADYLTEQVLNRQPDHVRRFILSTSVLDRMSGSLCDFVTGHSRSLAMLEELHRTSMFITRVESRPNWFRYHQLFRMLLRHHLRQEDPALEYDLVRRAAAWHLQRDDVDAAMTYLADAGAWDDLLREASTHSASTFALGDGRRVASWIERVPPSVRRERGRALLLEAAALIFGGAPTGVAEALDAVDNVVAASSADGIVADLLRSYWAVIGYNVSEAIDAADRVLSGLASVDDADLPDVLGLTGGRIDVSSAAFVSRGIAYMYQGRLSAARCALEGVPDDAHGVWRAIAMSSLALVEAWSGNLTTGEQLALRAVSFAEHVGLGDSPITNARHAFALVALQRGDLGRAGSLLDDLEARPGGSPHRAVAAWIATERAHLALAASEPAAGLAILTRQRAGENAAIPCTILARRSAIEALLHITLGELDSAEAVLDAAPEGNDSDVMAARTQLAVERRDLATARALLAGWSEDRGPRARLERRLWLSIVKHLEGDEAGACANIAAVVAEAEPQHNVDPFILAGRHALGPARTLYKVAPTAFLRTIVDRPVTAGRAIPVKEFVEQLTEREYIVLALLPTRLSNTEIAERLGVSLNTIKTHLKHIYRKFDVVGRRDAVDTAERLRLL